MNRLPFQIKQMIISGELQAGDYCLHASLSKELRISVITTKRAYDDLERMVLSIP